MILHARTRCFRFSALWIGVFILGLPLLAQSGPQTPHPWNNTSLSPDERAAMVVKEMTLDEKITLLHGTGHGGAGADEPTFVRVERRSGICGWNSAPGDPRNSDVGRRLRGTFERT